MILPDQAIPITLWEWLGQTSVELSKGTSKELTEVSETIPVIILTIDLTLYLYWLTISADAIAQRITFPTNPCS